MSEARELTEERIQELAALPLEEVLRYEDHPVREETTGPSGRRYRVHTYAFCDTDPDDSGVVARVDVRGRGLYWWQRYHGIDLRWTEDDDAPPEPPEVSSTWTENFACLTLVLIVLGLPLSLLYAIRRFFG